MYVQLIINIQIFIYLLSLSIADSLTFLLLDLTLLIFSVNILKNPSH
jgi:hypothetical protein